MLKGLFNAAAGAVDTVKKAAIKPFVIKGLSPYKAEAEEKLNDLALACRQDIQPALKGTLVALHRQATLITQDFFSDEIYNILIDIGTRQPAKFASKKALENLFKDSVGTKKTINYLNDIINVDNYKQLNGLIKQYINASKLPDAEKIDLLKENPIIAKILAENQTLDIKALKKDLAASIGEMARELELSPQEHRAIITHFEALTERHVPTLESIRNDLLKHLPVFIEAEKQKIRAQNPHLAVREAAAVAAAPVLVGKRKAPEAPSAAPAAAEVKPREEFKAKRPKNG